MKKLLLQFILQISFEAFISQSWFCICNFIVLAWEVYYNLHRQLINEYRIVVPETNHKKTTTVRQKSLFPDFFFNLILI